ncbi:MAG: hypothetical protein ABI550_06610, partial [Ignavibacteriaceae bacterium]
MKKFLIFSIITGVVVLVTSCSKKSSEENSSNTIAFEIKHYKKTYGNCDSTNGPCAEVKFEYPLIINGPNEDAKKKVNENIMNTLLTPVYNDNSSYQNFDSLADDLIEDYKSFINEFPDSYQQWALEKKITVENAADTI